MSISKDVNTNQLALTPIAIAKKVVDKVLQTLTALENTGKEADPINTAQSSGEGGSSSRCFGNNKTTKDNEEQEEENVLLKDKDKEKKVSTACITLHN